MGRLMKYDLRAALRLFVPLWLGTLVLALVNGFTMHLEYSENPVLNFLTGLVMVLYVLAVFAILILTGIYAIQRFYQSMLKDEGYLTFTLPVGIDSILWSKALTAMILSVCSAVVCVLSLLLLVVRDLASVNLSGFFEDLLHRIPLREIILTVVCFGVMLLAAALATLFLIYLSMALGQFAQKHRLAASVGAFVAIQVLMSFLLTLPASFTEYWDVRWIPEDGWFAACVVFLLLAAGSLVQAAIYYFPTRYLFQKRLNLE